MTGRLFIRTEASATIGLGHFMRCFAVAEAARARGIDVIFVMSPVPEFARPPCGRIGATLQTVGDFGADLSALPSVLLPRDWVVVDSYKATADYLGVLHRCARLAVIDDLNELDHFDCDLIVNAAMAAPREAYRAKSTARLLLGAEYALIRQEFLV